MCLSASSQPYVLWCVNVVHSLIDVSFEEKGWLKGCSGVFPREGCCVRKAGEQLREAQQSTGYPDRKKLPKGGLETQGMNSRLHWPQHRVRKTLGQGDKATPVNS